MSMSTSEILTWLRQNHPDRLAELYARADDTRRRAVGDAVHLRGLVEISNHCVRSCVYCGLSVHNRALVRYRMNEQEILHCARQAVEFGYGTLVMQAGEDYGIEPDWLAQIIRRIKSETPLAVTLSLGERPGHHLHAWKRAGADRYLLRFETSDRVLYQRIHPSLNANPSDRIQILHHLRELGYEIGSGVMIGIPGQTFDSLARDIETFAQLDLDMIGVGPYLPHPQTPLASAPPAPPGQQVPNSEEMTYKVLALTRIACPQANLPSTTALATVNTAHGRELGLQRGANVVMPNLTPAPYRALYEIYPGKACIGETAAACQSCLKARIAAIGRTVGLGLGARQRDFIKV